MTTASGAPGGIRLLIADSSAPARRLLASLCEQDPAIRVIGEAASGAQAAELTRRLRPSLVLMADGMLLLDGLEHTTVIMRETPTPIIVVASSTSRRHVEAGLSAMRNGAVMVLPKPSGPPGTPGFIASGQHLVTTVKAMAGVKVIRRRTDLSSGGTPTGRQVGLRIVGVAASTGGPPALLRFLQELDDDLPVPVVAVQHIVPSFVTRFVSWLGAELAFHVTEAVPGQRLEAGTVYVAGAGCHLEVDRSLRARLTLTPPVAGFRPSATVLFSSLARALGPAAAGVVLTGMGSDGLDGLRELRDAGGRVLAQDPQSCVVYGMPRAVTDAGLVHTVGTVEQLARNVSALAKRSL